MKLSNPETLFVLASLGEWEKLYIEGKTCSEIAIIYGVNKSTVNRRLKEMAVPIRTKSSSKMGSRNPMWKESDVGNSGLHAWVKTKLQRPENCQACGVKPPLDLANVSPKYDPTTYNRDLSNWRWLCRKCHMISDGRLSGMYHGGAKSKHIGCSVPGCVFKHEGIGLCSKHYQSYRYNKKVGKLDHSIMQYVSQAQEANPDN